MAIHSSTPRMSRLTLIITLVAFSLPYFVPYTVPDLFICIYPEFSMHFLIAPFFILYFRCFFFADFVLFDSFLQYSYCNVISISLFPITLSPVHLSLEFPSVAFVYECLIRVPICALNSGRLFFGSDHYWFWKKEREDGKNQRKERKAKILEKNEITQVAGTVNTSLKRTAVAGI